MPTVHGGHLVARSLKREGIECIFSLSGGHISHIYDACIDEGIKIYDTRHEQGAAFMADAWGRYTGKTGVLVVTAGPGFTNAVTGIASASMAGSPVLFISGRSATKENDTHTLQEMDQLPIISSITKWSRTILETPRIPEYINLALRQVYSGRPGPVYLEVPIDILIQNIEEEKAYPFSPVLPSPRIGADPDLIRRAIELMESSEHPVIVAGTGIQLSRTYDELRQFVEFSGMPIFTKAAGRGCIPDSHPLCFGPANPIISQPFWTALPQADLLILLGTRLDMFFNYGRPPVMNPETKIIQVDVNPTEFGTNRPVALSICADLGLALPDLLSAYQSRGKSRGRTRWVETLREVRSRAQTQLEEEIGNESLPIHPLRLMGDIRKSLDSHTMVVADGGDTQIWSSRVIEANAPTHYLDAGLFGCLGVGIPFALAAKIAHPGNRVLLIAGDGAVGFNLMEFNTAIRHQIPFVCVVNNDDAFGMIKHQQEICYGRERVTGCELGFVHYEKIVEALGGYGELVEKPGDIIPAIKRGFDSGRASLINVKTDPDAVSQGSMALASFISGYL